ncbi:MAG: hypothetical protein AAFX90_09060 [Pseudomonadota bacterium]
MQHKHRKRIFIQRRYKSGRVLDTDAKKALLLLLAMLLAFGIASAQKALAADIRPKDGVWQGATTVRQVNGCTPEIQQEIKSGPQTEILYHDSMTFKAPFDFKQFNRVLDADVRWTKQGPNQWHGTVVETERTMFGAVTSTTELKTLVASDTRINQTAVMTVSFSRRLAEKLGVSAPCVVDIDITHRHLGP